MIFYVTLRVLLWLIAVAIALFPTLLTAGVAAITWPLWDSVQIINGTGQFRDLIFIVVVVAMLEISFILDFLYSSYVNIPRWLFSVILLALLVNILSLAGGLLGFMGLPAHGEITDLLWLTRNSMLIGTGIGLGLLTEIVVSCASHHFR